MPADEGFSWALTGRFEGIDGRFDALDRRVEANRVWTEKEVSAMRDELGEAKEQIVAVTTSLTSLASSWGRLSTALYSFSIIVVAAAVTLILIGKPL